jgi:hypothetical protein
MIPFSVLDLSPIIAGGDAALALRNTLDLDGDCIERLIHPIETCDDHFRRHTRRWG